MQYIRQKGLFMKSGKNLFIALLLVATSSGILAMDPAKAYETAKTWSVVAVRTLLLQEMPRGTNVEKELTIPNDPTPFIGLPKDVQNIIIGLIISGRQAKSLKEATGCINSLAQVNKHLNETLNNPLYCFKIIKTFATRFNVSDERVCRMLQTNMAKSILANQIKLYQLCSDINSSQAKLTKKFNKLLKNNIDLNFTYGHNQTTALIVAASKQKPIMVELLLQSGADPEIADEYGTTPLIVANDFGTNEAVLLIIKASTKNNKQ